MTVHAGLLRLSTEGNGDVVDLTEGVRRVLQQAGADRGVVTVFVTGSTASRWRARTSTCPASASTGRCSRSESATSAACG